jgi:hypothetical protein
MPRYMLYYNSLNLTEGKTMQVKKLCLSAIIMANCAVANVAAMSVEKGEKFDRAQVTKINMVAQDKDNNLIEFDINAECGNGYQNIGKIIMSDKAAKDEALLLRYKYGPQVAQQFSHYWNTKASESSPRMPTVAMFIYPKKGHQLMGLLNDKTNRQQQLAKLNQNQSMKVMVAQDEQSKGSGEIIMFACGGKEHPPL